MVSLHAGYDDMRPITDHYVALNRLRLSLDRTHPAYTQW